MFEDNPYAKLISKPVQSRLLMCEGDSLLVNVPDKNCVLGDKLTAFAPHTTGIGGDYPPTSRIANVYTFALLAGNELIVIALTALQTNLLVQ